MKLVFLLDTIAVGFEPNVLPIELIGKHKYKISWIDFYCDFFFNLNLQYLIICCGCFMC